LKAILIKEVRMIEVDNIRPEYGYHEDDVEVFEEGVVYEVIPVGKNQWGYELYAIIDKESQNATVVYEGLLEFIEEEEHDSED